MARIKISAPQIQTRSQLEALLGDLAEKTSMRDQLMADLNARITSVRADFDGQISKLNKELEEKHEQVMLWAVGNKMEFGEKRSIEFLHGVVGWRLGNKALKPLKKWTWDRVLEKLRENWLQYVRKKEEVNKEQILIDRNAGILEASNLESMGVQVDQAENFFIELKLEKPENQ